jgi:hypothetical protein
MLTYCAHSVHRVFGSPIPGDHDVSKSPGVDTGWPYTMIRVQDDDLLEFVRQTNVRSNAGRCMAGRDRQSGSRQSDQDF